MKTPTRLIDRTTTMLATPNPMTSHLLSQAIEANTELRVVQGSTEVAELIGLIEQHKPDVLLVSIHVRTLSANRFQHLATVLARHPEVACVVLLDSNDPETVVDAFRARARGVFVCGESDTLMLQKCIIRVAEGQVWADTAQLRYVLAALPSVHASGQGSRKKSLPILTPREEEVVWLVADGLSNREVANRLQLSENTIKNYMFHIFEKLGFSNRVEVVLYAAARLNQRETSGGYCDDSASMRSSIAVSQQVVPPTNLSHSGVLQRECRSAQS